MTSFFPPRQGSERDARMRVSDAERNQVAEELSRHFGDGRLDQAELDERMARTMGAKTRADLSGLLDDLPPVPPSAGSGSAAPEPDPAPPRRRSRLPLVLLIIVLAWLLAGPVSALAWFPGVHHFLWPVLIVAAVLLVCRRRGYGCGGRRRLGPPR